jgi:LCP family protein required for cell wall assembly
MKPRQLIRWMAFATTALAALGCGLGSLPAGGSPLPSQTTDLSPTPTPFLPEANTATPYLPGISTRLAPFVDNTGLLPGTLTTPTPPPVGQEPWAPYAGPIYPAPTRIPSPVAPIPSQSGVMNIALLGSDVRPAGGSFRTDTTIILSLSAAKGTVTMVSFPRDLYVYLPAYGMQRLNVAFPIGGSLGYSGGDFGLFRDTMMYNFGLRVDHWLLMDFSGFEDLVNSLGGINVQVGQTLTDHRAGYGAYTVHAGLVHMDGATALWYVRARYSTSDFDRNRRQQEVLVAIAKRALNLNALSNLPAFFSQLHRFVTGDLALQDLLPYAGMATSVNPDNVRRFRIVSPTQCYAWITPGGADVQLPRPDAIRALLQQALSP